MDVTFNASWLAKPLQIASSVIERRSNIPALAYVKFEARGETLTLTVTDQDNTLTMPIGAKVKEEGMVCLRHAQINSIIKRLGCEQVRLATGTSRASLVDGGSFSAVFDIDDGIEEAFPSVASNSAWLGKKYSDCTTSNHRALSEPLARCLKYASTEETRYYLSGVYLHEVDGKLLAVATDGHTLCTQTVDSLSKVAPKAIIPRKTVKILEALTKIATGGVNFWASEELNRCLLYNRRYQLYAKTIDGTYPDYQRIVPTKQDMAGGFTVDRQRFLEALQRVTGAGSSNMSAVRIKIQKPSIVLRHRNGPEAALLTTALDTLEIQRKKRNTALPEFGLRPEFLAKTLQQIDDDMVDVRITDAASPVLITAHGADRGTVIMPIRI